MSKCDIKEEPEAFDVASQVNTGNGIIDILLSINDNEFSIAIENKIQSGFGRGQIKKYEEYVNSVSKKKGFVLALIQNRSIFDEKIGVPYTKVYWFELGKFIENELKQNHDVFLKEFLNFLKEENMAINKVEWQLVDGVRAHLNLVKMLEDVIRRLTEDGTIVKIKTKSRSAALYWDYFAFRIKEEARVELSLTFYHEDVTLWGRFKSQDKKYNNFSDHPFWKGYKVIGKFDFAKEHFFPLDSTTQEEKLLKSVKGWIETFREKVAK